jgi:hypothetical protein
VLLHRRLGPGGPRGVAVAMFGHTGLGMLICRCESGLRHATDPLRNADVSKQEAAKVIMQPGTRRSYEFAVNPRRSAVSTHTSSCLLLVILREFAAATALSGARLELDDAPSNREV